MAKLHELETIYSVADLYEMIEIHTVEAYNRYLASRPKK